MDGCFELREDSHSMNLFRRLEVIRMRWFVLLCFAVVPHLLLAADQPNIVFILADDVGREVLGCYGGESYQTPNIDKLAAGGMRFEHCYSMPVCHPSRICLLTGRYPVTIGEPRWGSFPKDHEAKTFASLLKKAGYQTAVAGKWQLSLMKKDTNQPERMGFDEWSLFGWHEGPRYHEPMIYQNGQLRDDTKGKYGPDLYVDFLIDFMSRNKQQPFMAYYSMALCHDVTDDLKEPVPYGPNGRWLSYEEMAHDMDHQVGRLIKAIDQLGLRDNTAIIFTTDNGTAAASYERFENGKYIRPKVFSKFHGRMIQGGKGKLNDWGTRVPLIANWPGKIEAGQVADDLVDFSDFLPTFMDLANATIPDEIPLNGHSFADRILRGTPSDRAWVYAELRGKRFVKTREFKLYGDGMFFDLRNDPEEKTPLKEPFADDAAMVRQELQNAMAPFQEE